MHAPTTQIIPADLLLLAYRSGIFPMSDSREDEDVFWVEPRERAVIPPDEFHLSRSLAKVIKQDRFLVTCNRDFAGVIEACAQPRPGHPETWISRKIAASYRNLHRQGIAHSIECWTRREDCEDALVGGLYGVSFDRVFCGESMFSRADNASKVALAWLVGLMRRAGLVLLDCQFMTDHLASLGAVEIARERYQELLADAKQGRPRCTLPEAYAELSAEASCGGASSPGKLIAHSLTQTS